MSRGYLLDTNVISELAKGPRAARSVLDWMAHVDEDRLYLSVITLGEIEKGVVLAEEEGRDMRRQREFLTRDLPDRFGARILAFGIDAALAWGRLLKELRRNRDDERRLAVDAQIAATAQVADLVIATRNTRDFARLGVSFVTNPFEPSGSSDGVP